MENDDPLSLFPLEVWELVLDQVEDAETVYAVLKTFPSLDEGLHTKKSKWLIGKIIPFVSTWGGMLTGSELMKCRAGNKNWQRQMDHFLEREQPRVRPHDPSTDSDERFLWNCGAHMPPSSNRHNQTKEGPSFGVITFQLAEDEENWKVENFVKQMDSLSKNAKPFPARALAIVDDGGSGMHEFLLEPFRENVKKVLEKFGDQIWLYTVDLHVPRTAELLSLTWGWLAETLALLPNLKTLRLRLLGERICLSNKTSRHAVGLNISGAQEAVSELPHLESIIILGDSQRPCFQINIFEEQTLRKIAMPFNNWQEDNNQFLQTVTELKLTRIYIKDDASWTRVKLLLLSLDAPQLTKLELELYAQVDGNDRPRIFIEQDILLVLKRFPSLEYFCIGYERDYENGLVIQEAGATNFPVGDGDCLPSIKFFSVWDSPFMSYRFLVRFPNLMHLRIYRKVEEQEQQPRINNLPAHPSSVREDLRNGTMHLSICWELLPKLKSVCVSTLSGSNYSDRYCDREKYERMKRLQLE